MLLSAMRIAAVLTVTALLGACAQPARTSAMVADVTGQTVLPEGSPLANAVAMGDVTGGEATNPAWTSEVGNPEFRQALTLSLQQHTILAETDAPMTLVATLVNMDQPLVGFDMTVTSSVAYKITNTAGEEVFNETISVPYTASFSDAFVGAERLRLANEGAIKANIKRFIETLIARSKDNPAEFGAPLTSGLKLNLG